MSTRRIAPASARPGSRRWPGFSRKKVTLAVASTASPRILPVSPSIPEGTSTASTRPACMAEGVDPLDDRLRFAIDVARKPRAEQSVDHAVGSSEVNCRGGEDRARIASGGERGIAFQGVSTAEQAEFDRVAALAEQAAGDEAVAAVASRAAEHDDPAARLRKPRRFVSDRKPRPLHELNARRSRPKSQSGRPCSFQLASRVPETPWDRAWRRRCASLALGARGPKTPFPSRRILLYRASR